MWSVLRLAWFPAAGLGAAAALVQAVVLLVAVWLPVRVLLWGFDTVTVLRGGSPPALLDRPTTNQPGPVTGDWDRALAELVADTNPTEERTGGPTSAGFEHGIRLGSDGQALDPGEQLGLVKFFV